MIEDLLRETEMTLKVIKKIDCFIQKNYSVMPAERYFCEVVCMPDDLCKTKTVYYMLAGKNQEGRAEGEVFHRKMYTPNNGASWFASVEDAYYPLIREARHVARKIFADKGGW